jgi:hypothetical protein
VSSGRADPFAVEPLDGVLAVVAVRGLTHGPDAERLFDLLTDLVEQGRTRLVVDLRSSRLLNSKLLDALARVSARLDPRRGEGLAVVTETDYVLTMLEIAASGGVLMLASSRGEALEALSELD